jgi:hypothetical protein
VATSGLEGTPWKKVTYEWVFQSVLRRLQGLAASYSSIA